MSYINIHNSLASEDTLLGSNAGATVNSQTYLSQLGVSTGGTSVVDGPNESLVVADDDAIAVRGYMRMYQNYPVQVLGTYNENPMDYADQKNSFETMQHRRFINDAFLVQQEHQAKVAEATKHLTAQERENMNTNASFDLVMEQVEEIMLNRARKRMSGAQYS